MGSTMSNIWFSIFLTVGRWLMKKRGIFNCFLFPLTAKCCTPIQYTNNSTIRPQRVRWYLYVPRFYCLLRPDSVLPTPYCHSLVCTFMLGGVTIIIDYPHEHAYEDWRCHRCFLYSSYPPIFGATQMLFTLTHTLCGMVGLSWVQQMMTFLCKHAGSGAIQNIKIYVITYEVPSNYLTPSSFIIDCEW